jgi:hypothetical protein
VLGDAWVAAGPLLRADEMDAAFNEDDWSTRVYLDPGATPAGARRRSDPVVTTNAAATLGERVPGPAR